MPPAASAHPGKWQVKRAEHVALRVWGNLRKCDNPPRIRWRVIGALAESRWYSDGSGPCWVYLNPARHWTYALFCTALVHEYGHLDGRRHNSNRYSVMYPVIWRTFHRCR